MKLDRVFITHCDENYVPIVEKMIESVRTFSSVPIIVYVVNSSVKVKGADETIRLDFDVRDGNQFLNIDGSNYVDRKSYKIYDIITKKVDALEHALENKAKHVVYLDGDSVATNNIDKLFEYININHPMFTQGIDEVMILDGKGNPFVADVPDLSKTLEHNLCELLGVKQEQHHRFPMGYVQTGYISVIESNLPFIKEWRSLCELPEIKSNPNKYAPFHEETIVNVLLWKYNYNSRMPLVYVNAQNAERVKETYTSQFNPNQRITRKGPWFAIPPRKEDIATFHGAKDPQEIDKMIETIKQQGKKRILFVAPHLSTGGMPQFLLKRVEALINEEDLDIHVFEFSNYSDQFVVQKNQLKELLGDNLHLNTQGNTPEKKEELLLEAIETIRPDIIHIEETPESFDVGNKISNRTLSKIYRSDRPYQIVETCHNIWMGHDRKTWHPNSYMYCTPYHPLNNFKGTPSAGSTVEYPIENLAVSEDQKDSVKLELGFPDKINVVNVGLWTSGKNQGEGVEIARIAEERYPGKFQFHFVGNQAGNFQDYWEPIMKNLPSNVTVWGERHDTHLFYQAADAFMFNSTWECAPLSLRESIAHRLPTFTRNLPQYLDMFTSYIIPFSDDLEENATILLRELIESGKNLGDFMPPTNDVERFKQQMLAHYSETHTAPEVTIDIKASVTYDRYVKLHVDQLPPSPHTVRFIDTTEDRVVYETPIQEGFWYSPSQHWFTPWRVEILSGGSVVWSETITTHGGEVAVHFDSSSLGDSLAWMGQILRFKEYWGFEKVWVKTFKNWLWDTEYYASRGVQIVSQLPAEVPKIYLGVFYSMEDPWKRDEHRNDWRKIHLAQIASDRLGIAPEGFKIEKPQLAPQFQKAPTVERPKPIVTFATQSTAGAKYWNREMGWQELCATMPEYYWIHTSKEGGFRGDEQAPEALEEVAGMMLSSKFFVGISSGLSWFAWALGVKTFVISGFTPEVCESGDGIVTIQNPTSCNSCWAWGVFDKGDWNWCPAHKDTPRQFECSKAITPAMVIEKIEQYG